MSFPGLHAIRRQQRTLARWVLALFCLVWVQAALLPCAMAVVPDGMAGAPEQHCVYCPPDEATDARNQTALTAACAYPDQPQADARATAATPLGLALPPVAYVLDPGAGPAASFPDDPRPPGRSGPPIAISYCRFLK